MKRFVSGVLCVAIVMMMVSVCATHAHASDGSEVGVQSENRQAANIPTRFDDIDSYGWAKDAIMDCVGKGLFQGTRTLDADGTGSFNPSGVLTKAEFVTVVVRYLYPNESVAKDGEQWWEPALRVAKEHGIIAEGDAISSDFQGQMTREEMAYVLVNAVESKEGKTDKIVLASQIPDMNKVDLTYSYYVRKAYTLGLITGKDGGVFDPNGLLTRAEGATVAYRMTTPSARKAVEPKVEEKRPFLDDGRFETGATHQEWVEGEWHSEPHVGDVVIKADGTRVVLEATKFGDKTVLGWGANGPQGVDPYTGTSGKTLNSGAWYDGSTFKKDERTGSVFSTKEWIAISCHNVPERVGTKDGEKTFYDLYVWDASQEQWFWVGP